MDQGWKRFHLLVVFLILWRNAVGFTGGAYSNVHPRWGRPSDALSPRSAQSSISEAPMTGVPVAEVGSSVPERKSRTRFASLRQYTKGGFSGSSEPTSHALIAPSGSVSASFALPQDERHASSFAPLQLQGSSGASVLGIAGQPVSGLGSLIQSASQSGSGPLSASSPVPVSTQGEGSIIDSIPLSVSAQSTSSLNSPALSAFSSQGSSGHQLVDAASLGSIPFSGLSAPISTSQFSPPLSGQIVSSQGVVQSLSQSQDSSKSTSDQSPPSLSVSTSQGSSSALLAASGFFPVAGGMSPSNAAPLQSLGTASQYAPGTPTESLKLSSLGLTSSSTSDQSSRGLYVSSAPSRTGTLTSSRYGLLPQTGASSQLTSFQGGSSRYSGSRLQSQSASSQQVSAYSKPISSPQSASSPSSVLSSRRPYTSASQSSSGPQLGGSFYSGSIPSQGTSTQFASGSPTLSKLSSPPFSVSSQPTSGQTFYSRTPASQVGSSLMGTSSQLVSSQGSSYFSGSIPQSQGTLGQYAPGSATQYAPMSSPQGTSSQSLSSPKQSTATSQVGSRAQLSLSSPYPVMQGGSASPLSSSQLASGSPQYASLSLSQGVAGQYSQAAQSAYSQTQASQRLQPSTSRWAQGIQASGASPSSSPSQSFQVPSRLSSLAGGPSQLASIQGSGSFSGSSLQASAVPSQFALGSPEYPSSSPSLPQGVASESSQAVQSAYSQTQASQRWQPSTSRWAQGIQASGASPSSSLSQSFQVPSKPSSLASAGGPSQLVSVQGSGSFSGSSLQASATPSQFAVGSPQYPSSSPSLPQGVASEYSQAVQSAYSQTQASQRWQPSTSRWAQGIQASGASPSSSLSQSFQVPSKPSSLASAGGPSQLVSVQGSGSFSGSSLQASATPSQFAVGSPQYPSSSPSLPQGVASEYSQAVQSAYSQTQASQRWQPSTSRWAQGIQASGASPSSSLSQSFQVPSKPSSLASAGGPSQLVSVQGSGSFSGSSLQASATPSQFAVGSPQYPSLSPSSPQGVASEYSQAAPGIYPLPQSQSSQRLQPTTSRWAQGTQTSGAAQSSSPTPSRFPSLSSAGGPSPFVSTQGGSGRYSGLSLQSQGSAGPYTPGSPAFAKLGISSQSTSDQSSYGLYSSSSQRRAGAQLATSSQYVSEQGVSGFDSSLQPQGTSSQFAPVPPSLGASLPVSSQVTPSGSFLSKSQFSRWQGVQTSGTAALQGGSSQSAPASSGLSSLLPALSPPVSVAQSGQTASSPRKTQSSPGAVQRHSRLFSSQALGSATSRPISGSSASLQHPTDSSTSLGFSAQASGGMHSALPQSQTGQAFSQASFQGFSSQSVSTDLQPSSVVSPYEPSVGGQGASSSSTSGVFSSYGSMYGQSAPASQSRFSSGRYYSSVKG